MNGPLMTLTAFTFHCSFDRVMNGIVTLVRGEKTDIFTIKGASPTLFSTMESCSGREITAACLSLSTLLSLPWEREAVPVYVPDPEFCIGCGRRLWQGRCPYLTAKGLKSHPARKK